MPTTTDPQVTARALLHIIGIEVPDTHRVVLTDTDDTGAHDTVHAVNPGQLDCACDQYRLVTGESVDADALASALPWL